MEPADIATAPGETNEARALAALLLLRWYRDPVRFAWDVFGVQLWRKQRQIARALAAARAPVRIAVKSGHKVGKSLLLAILALWWWVTRRSARVIMTAPTARQIRSTLWREIKRLWGIAAKRLRALGGLGGRLHELPALGLQHADDGEQSEVIGFSSSQPENLAGTSGENILYLIDEASGVKRALFEALDGNRAGGASWVLFSNPTQTSGEFFDAFHAKKTFYITFSISSEETPNVRCGRRVVGALATRGWILEKREEWGPDYLEDPRYRVRVLGDFPRSSSDQVVALADIERAKFSWYTFAAKVLGRSELLRDPAAWSSIVRTPVEIAIVRGAWMEKQVAPLQIGVDPAHYGDDLSVIYPRRGLRLFRPTTLKHGDGQNVADAVLAIVREMREGLHEKPRVLIDDVGVGVSAYDSLQPYHEAEIVLVPVNTGKKPTEGHEDEFLNLRAEIAFTVKRWIRRGGGFEPEQRLEDDLLAPKYWLDGVGRIQIESKKELKKRIGRSPDYGDGCGLSVFDGVMKFRVVHAPIVNRPLRFGEQQGRGFG